MYQRLVFLGGYYTMQYDAFTAANADDPVGQRSMFALCCYEGGVKWRQGFISSARCISWFALLSHPSIPVQH